MNGNKGFHDLACKVGSNMGPWVPGARSGTDYGPSGSVLVKFEYVWLFLENLRKKAPAATPIPTIFDFVFLSVLRRSGTSASLSKFVLR